MRYLRHFFVLALGVICSAATVHGQETASMARFLATPPTTQNLAEISGAATPCVSGSAAGYACNGVDLLALVPLGTFGSSVANDIWGWTDPLTNNEYAIIGLSDGTGFVDVTDPVNPVYLGKLPTHTSSSSWRDVKVYADHAFVVSEASGHGMQVFDLTELRNVASPPATFAATAHYSGVSDVHNIVINEDSGYAYTVGNNGGGTTCSGGLHMIDISTPTSPTFAGCYSGDGYTHDAQCVIYSGPDAQHLGKEICIASNEDTITIVDVSNKSAPVQLSRTGYPNSSYVHQGWLTDDQAHFYQDDELDGGNTRTLIWDLADLDSPVLATEYFATTTSKDHNQYVVGDVLYQANYTTGLRVLDITNRTNPVETAFFDTYTPDNGTSFNGAWSNYPYFASGTIIVSSIGEGLFVLGVAPSPPGATDVHVENITTGTQGGGKRKYGTASVTIFDDLGQPASGYSVTGTFGGSFDETQSGTTNASGVVTFVTSARKRNPNVSFCVDDVTGALPYDAADNTNPSYACGGSGGDPTDVHVASISTGSQGAGGGQKRGKATVTILDDLGQPAVGYTVTGNFSGDISQTGASATTNASGVATILTSAAQKGKVNVSFCVSTVSGALPYDPSDNGSGSYACAASKHTAHVPDGYVLEQNFPNPFNPATVIRYTLPEAGVVSLTVYDALGRHVATLAEGPHAAGRHEARFDAGHLSAGVYFYVIEGAGFRLSQRMTLLK